ncbi:putative MFS-type transporter YhjX [compost metagenome]
MIALAGMMLQLSIGSVYAYSVWIKPINLSNGWDAHQLKLAFSLAICFLGLTAAFMGKFVQKIGPQKAGLLGAIFWGAGLLGSGFAASQGSLPLFYFFYGIISGIGLGFGYITPVSVVVKWFTEKPGFASGLVIMSFAAGSIIASKIIPSLAATYGVPNAFYILGITYFILMLLASIYLTLPETTVNSSSNTTTVKLSELLSDLRFYSLWLMLFFNTTCGIALIAIAAPMAKDIIHINDAAAITFVATIGLFNGLGRLIWSSISDKIGRWNTFMAFFLIGAICFLVLSNTQTSFIFQVTVFIIISCYGGAFATMPAFVKDIYGTDKVGSVLGYVLTAWSAAAFAGPWLITVTTNYSMIFYLFAGLLILIAAISLLVKSKLQNKIAVLVIS